MKKLMFLVAAILCSAFIQIQAQSSACGTIADEKTLQQIFAPSSSFNLKLNEVKRYNISGVRNIKKFTELSDSDNFGLTAGVRRVPITAHILRRSNNTGGISKAAIQTAVNQMNTQYRPMNIEFYVCTYNYIKSNTHYNHSFDSSRHPDYISRANIDDRHNVDKTINIYFVPNSRGVSWSSFPWMPREHIVMWNNHVTGVGTTNVGVLGHELGHWFGLLHTFETANGRELVNGSNCRTAGDAVCDTPADGRGTHNRSTCVYTDNRRDANGDRYRPDVDNMMSYYFDCLDDFTNGQEQVVQTTLLNERNDVLDTDACEKTPKEDCISFNPNTISIKNNRIVDGSHWIMSFPNYAEAKQAYKIIKHYGLNQYCFVGRPDPSFTYFLKNGKSPVGAYSGEDCIGFKPADLYIKKESSNKYLITDGRSRKFICPNRSEAEQIIAAIKKYGFTETCYVGRPQADMQYMRKDLQFYYVPGTLKPTTVIKQPVKLPGQ